MADRRKAVNFHHHPRHHLITARSLVSHAMAPSVDVDKPVLIRLGLFGDDVRSIISVGSHGGALIAYINDLDGIGDTVPEMSNAGRQREQELREFNVALTREMQGWSS